MCTNCMIYMALGVFVGWRIWKENSDPKLNQSFEDMREEMIEKEIKKREQL